MLSTNSGGKGWPIFDRHAQRLLQFLGVARPIEAEGGHDAENRAEGCQDGDDGYP
ncbi:MAG: hypothetical protein WDN06_18485 [Asticcacaulis sp.]